MSLKWKWLINLRNCHKERGDMELTKEEKAFIINVLVTLGYKFDQVAEHNMAVAVAQKLQESLKEEPKKEEKIDNQANQKVG